MSRIVATFLLLALTANSGIAHASKSIEVLWYTYADLESQYMNHLDSFGFSSEASGHGPGNMWDITLFRPGDAPDFSKYNVLVIESGEAFRTGAPGGPYATPDYSGILSQKTAIQKARGSRTFLSGSDADFHAVRGDTGNVSPSNSDGWDGAQGFVVNAVNWAADGSGLNIVSFVDGEFPGSFWWQDPESFLRSELKGYVTEGLKENTPYLAPSAPSAVMTDLTSLGMDYWNVSYHAGFNMALPGYSPVVESVKYPNLWMSIISDTATASVSEPGDLTFVGLGVLLGLRALGGRRRIAG